MKWYPFDSGQSIGQVGSENGNIIRDEEHGYGARITMERDGLTASFAITCGVFGWMVHTRFFGTESEAQEEFEKMKVELAAIMDTIPLVTDPEVDGKTKAVSKAISEFVERFP